MLDTKKNYEMLAAAIIGQACEDYCYALRKKEKYGPESPYGHKTLYKSQLKKIKNLEDFFYNYMNLYTYNNINPDELIARLKEVAADTENYKVIRFLKNHTKMNEI